MIIRLPHVPPIDTLNPPENLTEVVWKSFGKYTELTALDFTHEDKLSYLDNIRKFIHPGDADEYVKKMIMDEVEYQLDDQGEYPDKDEFYNFEFMCQCYERGDKEFCPETPFESNHHDADKTLRVISEIVKAVMTWAPDAPKAKDTDKKYPVSGKSLPPICRGIDIHTNEFVVGNYVNCIKPGDDSGQTGHYIVTYPGRDCDWHEVYTDSIGMYTGRDDSTKTRVFEHDIILIEETEYTVIWTGTQFILKDSGKSLSIGDTLDEMIRKESRVIDNVFTRRKREKEEKEGK